MVIFAELHYFGMAQQSCDACKKQASTDRKLLLCGTCRSVRYCDVKCQRSHWKTHKPNCSKKKKKMPAQKPSKPNITARYVKIALHSSKWFARLPFAFYPINKDQVLLLCTPKVFMEDAVCCTLALGMLKKLQEEFPKVKLFLAYFLFTNQSRYCYQSMLVQAASGDLKALATHASYCNDEHVALAAVRGASVDKKPTHFGILDCATNTLEISRDLPTGIRQGVITKDGVIID